MQLEPTILVVDPDEVIVRWLRMELKNRGFRVITSSNQEEASQIAMERQPDLILSELKFPRGSGMDLMESVRRLGNVPFIIVTANATPSVICATLDEGADNYITKPFDIDEVLARVRAVLRRARGAYQLRSFSLGNFIFDQRTHTLTKAGKMIRLTPTETKVLEYLVRNAGRLLSNVEIVTKIWGPEYRDDLAYLRQWIGRLRQKLDDSARQIIVTHEGIGYRLVASAINPT